MIIISFRDIFPLRYNIITMPRNVRSNMLPTGENIGDITKQTYSDIDTQHEKPIIYISKRASQKITEQNERYLRAIQQNREQKDNS